MKMWLAISLALVAFAARCNFFARPVATKLSPYPAQYSDKSLFYPVLTAASSTLERCTNAVVVPHHVLARDLVATNMAATRGTRYERVIIISPDHFTLGTSKVSLAPRGFATPFGILQSDDSYGARLGTLPVVSTNDFFYREHGAGALVPAVKYFWPAAKVVAIAIRSDATKADLDPVVDFLADHLYETPTLFVGSIDFSHYLPKNEADVKDARTKKLFEGGEPNDVWKLHQPDNLDSRGALYIVWSVAKKHKSVLTIVDHRNSQSYTAQPVDSTTSYFSIRFICPTLQ